jgi:hypothetical protein
VANSVLMSRIRVMNARIAITSSANRSDLIIFSIHCRTSSTSGTWGEVTVAGSLISPG